jgi:hypothetical protein
MFGKGKLHKDAVDIVAIVESTNDLGKPDLAYIFVEMNMLRQQTKLTRRFDFAVDVNRRRRVLADADGNQARRDPVLLAQIGGVGCDFCFDLIGDRLSAKDVCGHSLKMMILAQRHRDCDDRPIERLKWL